MAGALAQYVPGGLTLTFVVLLAALIVAAGVVARSPEGREPVRPRPSYRPQRLRAPAQARGQFLAATTGAFLTFAVGGLLAGLAGTFLAGPLHHPSAVLTGFAIFLNFGAGVLVQTTTTHWPAHRLIAAGIAPLLIGLVVLVASAWTSPASLALFLIGGAVAGVGGGAIIRGSLSVVISTASAADRAGALATYFTAGYVGVSLPVLGAGVALQYLSPRVTLLIFAAAVGARDPRRRPAPGPPAGALTPGATAPATRALPPGRAARRGRAPRRRPPRPRRRSGRPSPAAPPSACRVCRTARRPRSARRASTRERKPSERVLASSPEETTTSRGPAPLAAASHASTSPCIARQKPQSGFQNSRSASRPRRSARLTCSPSRDGSSRAGTGAPTPGASTTPATSASTPATPEAM